MSVDFRTRQLRVNQIINSGSTSTAPLLVYGLGSATDDSGGFAASHFTTGSDTWLFVSGGVGSKNSTSRGVVTFKGDVVISGTIYDGVGASYSTGGGSGVSYFDSTTNGSIFTTGSAAFRGSDSLDSPSDKGADVFFYVSGSSSSKVSLFGGNLVSSGSIILKSVAGSNSVLLSNLTGGVSGSGDFVAGGSISGSSARIYASSEGTLNLSSSLGESSISHASDGNFYVTNNSKSGLVILGATNSSGVGQQILKLEASSTSGKIFMSGSVQIGKDTADSVSVTALLASDIIPDGNRTRNLGSENARFANIYTGDLHLRNERGDWTIVEEADYLCVVNNRTGRKHKMVLQPID